MEFWKEYGSVDKGSPTALSSRSSDKGIWIFMNAEYSACLYTMDNAYTRDVHFGYFSEPIINR